MIETIAKNELTPESILSRLDLDKLFGRTAPVQVDLGCGDGSFLFCLAELYPQKNFLGIERLAHRVEKASRAENMRVLRLETSYAVQSLLPPQSVEVFYLLFPDPWPKRRHHRRRIITRQFLDSIHRALEPGGILRIATDHSEYFQQIRRVAANFTIHDSRALRLDGLKPSSSCGFGFVDTVDQELPQTRFERKFRAAGAAIYRLSLRKVSPVR